MSHILVPRPARAIPVTRGDLEPNTIARRRPRLIFPTSLTGHIRNSGERPGTRLSESGFIQGYYTGKTDLKFDLLSFPNPNHQTSEPFGVLHSAFGVLQLPLPHRVAWAQWVGFTAMSMPFRTVQKINYTT